MRVVTNFLYSRRFCLEHDMLSVLTDATDKTQKPFSEGVLEFRKKVMTADNPLEFMRNILKKRIRQNLFSGDKPKCDAINQLFSPIFDDDPELISDLEYHSTAYKWKLRGGIIFNAEADTERSLFIQSRKQLLFKTDMIQDLLDFYVLYS